MNIEYLDLGTIIEILLNHKVKFNTDLLKIFNKESQEWEDIGEHFYVEVEELLEEDNCYNNDNCIFLQLEKNINEKKWTI